MAFLSAVAVLSCCVLVLHSQTSAQYTPDWKSIDSRPIPAWFDEGKIGIFLHWGVFSVPSFESAWFWYAWAVGDPAVCDFMKKNYPPDFTYADFAPMFKAEFFNPNDWADLFEAAGARYVVLTSKHCEGFTNWPSKVSFNWNSMDVGPKRDLVGDLSKAIKAKPNLRMGLYHALDEWLHPLYMQDRASGFKTRNFALNKAIPELYELVNMYQPDLIWSDVAYDDEPSAYWNSTGFLAWLFNESPIKDKVVVNDRWGADARCQHGGYFTCSDRYNPGVLVKHKWENCMTLDKYAWTYRRNARSDDFISIEELLSEVASTISCGGNILINTGPRADGMISPLMEERLRQLGQWLKVNGEAIYASKPWKAQNDSLTPHVWYTSQSSAVYAILLNYPPAVLTLGSVTPSSSTTVTMVGYPESFIWKQHTPTSGIDISIPPIPYNKLPCQWAWVLKFTNL